MTDQELISLTLDSKTTEVVMKLVTSVLLQQAIQESDRLERLTEDINKKTIDIENRYTALRLEENKIKELRSSVYSDKANAEEMVIKAQKKLTDATVKDDAATERLEAVIAKEKSLVLREQAIKDRVLDIEKREKQLKDRTEVFVKSLKSGKMLV